MAANADLGFLGLQVRAKYPMQTKETEGTQGGVIDHHLESTTPIRYPMHPTVNRLDVIEYECI